MTQLMPFWRPEWIGRDVFVALGIYGNMGVAGRVVDVQGWPVAGKDLYWLVEGEESVYTVQMDKAAYVMEKKAK